MILVILFALVLGVLRVYIGMTIEPETPTLVDLYKTVSHFFVAGLFVAWWYKAGCTDVTLKVRTSWILYTAVAISLLELIVAIVSRA